MNKSTPAKNKEFNNDLFADWEQELVLRHQIRASSADDLKPSIGSEKELEILWRALYFSGRKDMFWSILFENLHLSLVLNWLTADDNRLDQFLAYLPSYFTGKKPEHKRLLHLVNLFAEKFLDRFRAIAAILDAEACSYLVSRSANPQFRMLMNQRLHFLQEKRSAFFYGLDEPIMSTSYLSLYGDKIKLLEYGLELLQVALEDDYGQNNRFNLKVEAAETFFRAGMVADSLALLIEAAGHQAADLFETETVTSSKNKHFIRLLRKVAASYCLIFRPETAGFSYSKIHHDYFPFQEPDQATLKYFIIFDLLKLSKQAENIYPLYQIAYEAELISVLRNNEYLLLSKTDLDQGLSAERIGQLKALVEQKLLSLPHEAFITIQLMYLLMEKNLADSGLLADFLLGKTLLLFGWVPSLLFLNQQFLTGLGPLIKKEPREEAERILVGIETCNCGAGAKLANKLELLKMKDNALMRQITAGEFLGVL